MCTAKKRQRPDVRFPRAGISEIGESVLEHLFYNLKYQYIVRPNNFLNRVIT